ncbi:cytokine receptor family member B12 isoform X2 [Conger conger]|uniref:cytokine receptor family member B12 isoform X2 n=1 Tax=Conger conger TaxID=82655 RepID=UPI002A5AE937|nr:cytokine receptor family member B12 isoform X2 [Conger conger]
MSWSSITGLTCLLCCVLMSAGRVSPPGNLRVTFLDFRGEVNWSSGKGNPPGTTYTVQVKPIGENWTQLENCNNIETTTCPLIFNLTLNTLMESYHVRVRASWEGKTSSWTNLSTSIQPYGNTLLSAPTLDISIQERELHVHIHMPWLVLDLLPNLRYNVQVFENNSGTLHVDKCSRREGSSYVCRSLHLGQNYCVTATAIHKHQQTKPHLSSEKCVTLPDNKSDKPMHIAVISILLLLVIIALVICFMYLYIKPRPSDLYTPSSLKAVGGASRTLMVIPTEVPSLFSSMWVITPSLSSSMTLPEHQSSCNWGYECRVGLSCLEQTANLPLLPAEEEELEEHLLSPCLYSGALDEKEQGYRISEEGIRSTQPRLEKMDWQLDQGYQDVPISSLHLCMDTAEPWEGCGESDRVSQEGEETDEGTQLPGLPWRNSSENLSGSPETPDKPKTLDKSDPLPTFPTGYEPHANPTSCEPISTACSPSPTFGQSSLYLKR